MTKTTEHKPRDAITLLKADHREVKEWFAEFADATSSEVKEKLAMDICRALTVHAQIEEQIFYPAFLKATKDKTLHHEAAVEHSCAKRLIGEIEDSSPTDEYFDSKVHVLSEMIKHHVKEEEQPDGMFDEARKADIDLEALGEQLLERKEELATGLEGPDREEKDPVKHIQSSSASSRARGRVR
jgi:hemerythrin superfamily protein